MSADERSEGVGVVGAGPFGVALSHLVAGAGRQVTLWSQDDSVVRQIGEERTTTRLPGLQIHERVRPTGDPEELAGRCRLVVMAVSSTDVRGRARLLGDVLDGRHLLVHAVGALASPGEVRVSEVLEEETPVARIGALAGPAFPDDLVQRRFASMVAASAFDEVSVEARRLLGVPPALRIYTSRDLIGVELAAALSSAYTVGLGIAHALEIGTGPRAVLITRTLAEASRLGAAAGADPRTFTGLSGLGNLLVQADPGAGGGTPSFRLGVALARGERPHSDRPPEGARAAAAGVRLAARYRERAPVLEAIAAVLDGRMSPIEAARAAADTVAMEE